MSSGVNLLVGSKEYFQQVVHEACLRRQFSASPAVQNYLVELLDYYLDARNLFNEPHQADSTGSLNLTLAELYLMAQSQEGLVRQETLRRLGERSLYVAGFFADSLNSKLVDASYYSQIGGTAYASLAEVVREEPRSHLYRTVSRRFLELTDVLGYISHKSMTQSNSSILGLYDRYMRTGSTLARDRLVEMGVITVPVDQAKDRPS